MKSNRIRPADFYKRPNVELGESLAKTLQRDAAAGRHRTLSMVGRLSVSMYYVTLTRQETYERERLGRLPFEPVDSNLPPLRLLDAFRYDECRARQRGSSPRPVPATAQQKAR